MIKRLLIIVVALLFLSFNLEKCTLIDKGQISQIKKNAVDTLIIGSNSFVLEAYIWRDFQPMCPENGRPMISINRLISTNSVKIPDNISMIKQYVIYKNKVWEANYDNETQTTDLTGYEIERMSSDGPLWGPEIYVDVISLIHDSKTKKDYYIIQKKVYVERTE